MIEREEFMVSQADKTVSRPDSIRAFADWLEGLETSNPDLAQRISINVSTWLYDKADITSMARALGSCNKTYDSAWFEMSRWFGQLRFSVNCMRQVVCEKRVVGTRKVAKPAVEAQPERIVEEEIVEWDCKPILELES